MSERVISTRAYQKLIAKAIQRASQAGNYAIGVAHAVVVFNYDQDMQVG